MNLAETIREVLTMYDALSRYGYELNRSGFMRCPFHEERTASFRVFAGGKRFHCFGCGEGGSVIDFVMKLFGITFRQAVLRIDVDFGLNLTGQRLDVRRRAELQRKRMEQDRALAAYRREYLENCRLYRYYFTMLKCTEPPKPGELLAGEAAQELAAARANLEYLDYWFEEQCGSGAAAPPRRKEGELN
jgi:hypothetical protein